MSVEELPVDDQSTAAFHQMVPFAAELGIDLLRNTKCAFLNLPPGSSGTTTIESKTNFLPAVRSGHATAISRPPRTGRRIVVVETDIVDDKHRLVARVTQSQLVRASGDRG